MKITLLMTPRLVMICTVCSVLLVALLVMLGFAGASRHSASCTHTRTLATSARFAAHARYTKPHART
jgi:hypothetical protein